MNNTKKLLANAIYIALISCVALPVMAETNEEKDKEAANEAAREAADSRVTLLAQADDEEMALEEVLITGTRTAGRTAADSPVPIDSFNAADLASQPIGDMTETLRNLVPSFTATPLTGDGSAFIRPTSLRGLPPDDTLVLINSKRRHRSALIAQFGAAMNSGSHATDVGHIPSIALKSVEVLRDGAAAQYGSDAIAGVINFILKDADHGGSLDVQFGEFYEGERSYKVAGNKGFKLTGDGFLNVSFEWTDNEQLVRSTQRPNAQALIDAGVHRVGLDSPYNDNPNVQTWGRPENDGLRLAFNAGIDLGGGHEFYSFGNYAETSGTYRFFYRDPGNSALAQMPINPTDPSQGNFCWCDTLTGGFTPFFVGDQDDISLVAGFKGELADSTMYDVSFAWGANDIDYTLFNTLNSSLGPDAPRNYDTGDLLEEDFSINADFSKQISAKANLAWGMELRQENYNIRPGEPASYIAGPYTWVNFQINPETGANYRAPNIGASGRSGFTPEGAGRFTRENIAAYVDVEYEVSDDTLLQFAARFENFDDFGTTTDGKFAFRHDVSDQFTVRGGVSTGFRAPTPGQSNVTSIATTFDGATGAQTQQGTVRPDDPLAISLGGAPLEPEESTSFSLGFSATPSDDWIVSLDLYRIDVDDRINKTQDIPIVHPLFTRLSFYTNALNTETTGIDLVAEYSKAWTGGSNTDFTFAWNHNKTDVVSQNPVNGVNPVGDTFIHNVEKNLPEDRFSVTARHYSGSFTTTVRANHYGSHEDERSPFPQVNAATLVDLSVNYLVNDNYSVTLGANNLFDEFPNKVASRASQGLPYPRRTPIGYDGGMWYLRGTYTFD